MADKKTKWILELVDEVTGPLNEIEREAKRATAVGEDLGDVAKDLGDDFEDLGNDVEVSADEIKSFTSAFSDIMGGFQTGDLQQVGAGFKSISDNIGAMTKSALGFIATPLGASLAGLAIVGVIATDFVRYNEAAREANILTAQLTKLSGDALSDARVQAKVIEETFGTDFKDTLEIAKNNVQAFDITYEEALDNIGDALVRGAAANDEFVDSLREYPRMFANAGYTMQEFQSIVDAGFNLGMYSDKLPDAIKELDLSLKEQTKASREALENAFGKKFTDDLFQNITDGTLTTRDALRLITEETDRVVLNNQQAAQLTADLFRGAGEDAGGYFEILEAVNGALDDQETALSGVEVQLNRVYEATEAYREAQQEALESDSYVAFAQEMEVFWLQIKTWYYDAVIWAQDWFNGTTKFYVQLIAAATELPVQLKNVFLNIVEDLNTLIGTFVSAGDIITNVLTGNWDEARNGFKNFTKDVAEDLENLGRDVVLAPAEIAKGIVDASVRAGEAVDIHRDAMAFYGNATNPTKRPDATIAGTSNGNTDDAEEPKKTTPRAGSGSGSAGRNITMTLNIVQNFTVSQTQDIEEVARETVRLINDKLRDAVITVS